MRIVAKVCKVLGLWRFFQLLTYVLLWGWLDFYVLGFLCPKSFKVLIVWASTTNTDSFSQDLNSVRSFFYFIISILVSTERVDSTFNICPKSRTLMFQIVLNVLNSDIIWSFCDWSWQESINFTIEFHWQLKESFFEMHELKVSEKECDEKGQE